MMMSMFADEKKEGSVVACAWFGKLMEALPELPKLSGGSIESLWVSSKALETLLDALKSLWSSFKTG